MSPFSLSIYIFTHLCSRILCRQICCVKLIKDNSYYIRTKLDSEQKPLLLIPQPEVEHLFRDIRDTLDIKATFPDITKDGGFQLGFQQENSPRPRYLGRLTNHCGVTDLEEMIPVEGSAVEESEELDESSFPIFRKKMQAAILSSKNKSRAAKDKKRKDRVETKKQWCAELKRAQCYLGLRPRGTASIEDFLTGPNMSWEESRKAQQDYETAAGIKLPTIDIASFAPYKFDQNVVFICIDIEAYEKDQKKITEIGVSTLDTLDLVELAPGPGGEAWMKKIRCRHFRVVEYAHLHNTDFIAGCADRFQESFGKSEWISIKEAPQVIASCFKPPFSAPGQYTPYPNNMYEVPRFGSKIRSLVNDDPTNKRNIVLLGHETRSDIQYLHRVGYDVGNLANVIEAMDTINLFRALKHEQNPRSLGAALLDLEIIGWNLHNAGNDAAYTTQALIRICIAARNASNNPLRQPSEEQLDEAAMEAKARLIEESDEWEAAEEEGGDGGPAIALLPAAEMADRQAIESALNRGRRADHRKEVRDTRRKPVCGAGRFGRASRTGSVGGGSKRVSESMEEKETGSMPFAFDAMDEAMGVGDTHWTNASWDGASDETIHTGALTDVTNIESKPAVSKSPDGYILPRLRPPKAQTKEVLDTAPEKPRVVTPKITEKTVERLKILDDGL